MQLVGGVVYLFMFLPVLLVAWLSVSRSSFLSIPPTDGYSLRWYRGLLAQTELLNGLVYSLTLAVAVTVISVAIGLMSAIALGRGAVRLGSWLEHVFVLPLVVPAIVSGVALYVYLYDLSVLIDRRLVPTTPALLLAHVVVTLPWTFRLLYGGVLSMGRNVERASLDLGRGPLATTVFVTLPMLRPVIVGAAVLAFVFSFGNLEISLFLVGPGRSTLPVAMMQYAEFKVDPTVAAMSCVQIALVALLLAVGNRFIRVGDAFGTSTRPAGRR